MKTSIFAMLFTPFYCQCLPALRIFYIAAFLCFAQNIQSQSGNNGCWNLQYTQGNYFFSDVFFVNASTGWATGFDAVGGNLNGGVILHTSDGGISWQVQASGIPTLFNAIYFTDSQTGWAVGGLCLPLVGCGNSVIYHTTDGGATWQEQTSFTSSALYDVHFTDNLHGWAVGTSGSSSVILHTSNGGASWQSQLLGIPNWLYSLHFIDNQTGWAVGAGGRIFRTLNGGASWQAQWSGTSSHLRGVHFTDSQTGWVVGNYGVIRKTSNGGASWQGQTSGTSNELWDVFFTDNQTGWVVGAGGVIRNTVNGGANWQTQTSGTSNQISAVYFIDSQTGWAASSNLILKYGVAPKADFVSNASGTTVSFTNISNNATSFLWDFGDGQNISQSDPSHNYLSPGTYTVTLIVQNPCGADTFMQSVTTGTLLPVVRYVNHAATGANNGTSWANAYTQLQDALSAAIPGDQIWVAKGVYKPTKEHGGATDRHKAFLINKDVAIYSGFNATENLLSQRDWINNTTVLSGDIGVPGDSGDNAYHVLYVSNQPATATLDGFTITGGMANGNSNPANWGGGIYIEGSGSTYNSNLTIANCTFSSNSALAGGAILNNNAGSLVLDNCIFSGNSASATNGYGGAVYQYFFGTGDPVLNNCIFSGNSAYGGGAVFFLSLDSLSSPVLTNCIFFDNSATEGGAMFNAGFSGACNPVLTNCTLSGNSANYGGAVYNWNYCNPTLTNCILWGNTAINSGNIFSDYDNATNVTISYSLVDASCTAMNAGINGTVTCGFGMIYNQDPMFADATSGDLHLKQGSPAIDKGDNSAVPPGITTDLDGNDRIFNATGLPAATVDMGPFEFPIQQPPGTDFTLIVSSLSGVGGTTLKVPVTSQNFIDKIGLQGSLHLGNPGQFKLLGVEDAALTGVSAFLVSGQESLNWFWYSPAGCLTLPQGDTLFLVKVSVAGQPGDCAPLYINGSPLALKAYQCSGNSYDTIPVATKDGVACILNNVQVSGKVTTINDSGVTADVTVGPNPQVVVTTGTDGAYVPGTLPGGQNYEIRPSKTDIDPDCIDVMDLFTLNNLLTGAWPYESNYQKMAADLDGNNIVETTDLISLQQFIGINTPFPIGKTWRFHPVKNPLPFAPNSPVVPVFNEFYQLPNLTADSSGLDFKAVPIGNLHNQDCITGNKPALRSLALALLIQKEYREKENLLLYHLRAQSWRDIVAIQAMLTFDPDQMEFLHVEPGCLDEWAFGALLQPQAQQGLLPLIWYAADPEKACRFAEDGTILCSLVFRLRQNAKPELCTLNNAETGMQPKAYDFAGTGMHLRLASVQSDPGAPRLLPNRPNPFTDETVIPVFLPESALNAEIQIMDVYGREIALIPVDGRGEVLVSFKSEGLTSGVYFYSLFVEGELTASRRMIVQR